VELLPGELSSPAYAHGPYDPGITAARPEHECAFLLGWIAALLLVALISVSLVLFLMPRIMG
jgi:hypothetical protein